MIYVIVSKFQDCECTHVVNFFASTSKEKCEFKLKQIKEQQKLINICYNELSSWIREEQIKFGVAPIYDVKNKILSISKKYNVIENIEQIKYGDPCNYSIEEVESD